MEKRYWCFRIDRKESVFFYNELKDGRLRQGWGYDESQDLRNEKVDKGAKKNKAMLNVRNGDIILVPRLPSYGEVTIVEATDDWNTGYRFEIPKEKNDYGHIFPAKEIASFIRESRYVNSEIRSTLKTPSRFWNVDQYSESIDYLITNVGKADSQEIVSKESKVDLAIMDTFAEVFKEDEFTEKLFEKMKKSFQSAEWETAIVYGLSKLFPYYSFAKVGGRIEKEHGTDILMKIPNILGENTYAVAIQVKDYTGIVSAEKLVEQINKADNYWKQQEQLQLIEKVVIFTDVYESGNEELKKLAAEHDIKLIFGTEFKKLVCDIGKSFMGISEYN